MSLTLHWKAEVEADLMARARESGMALEDYLLSLVADAPSEPPPQGKHRARSAREDAVRRMLEFGDRHHLTFGEPVPRALLHDEHRF
jgi:hypothetical protein